MLKREVARSSPAAAQPSAPSGAALASPTPGLLAGAGRLQVPGVRRSLSRIRGTTSGRDSRAICPSSRVHRTCSTSAAAAGSSWSSSAGAGIAARGIDLNHEMVETCRERGLDVTEADAVSYLSSAAGRIARRAVRRAGRRTPATRLPARLPRARLPQAPAGRPDRPRNAEPFVLGRVLRKLHPRHHTRLAAAPRDAAIPGRRERLHHRRRRVPVSGRGGGQASAGDGDRGHGAGPGRPRRLVQPQRREAERPDVHVPRLCGGWEEIGSIGSRGSRGSRGSAVPEVLGVQGVPGGRGVHAPSTRG